MTCCDTKLIQRDTSMLMMTSAFTPCHTHTNKRNQNSHKVSKLPTAVPEIGKKTLLLENKFAKINLHIWTKKKLRRLWSKDL
jgi:hypothetical protein